MTNKVQHNRARLQFHSFQSPVAVLALLGWGRSQSGRTRGRAARRREFDSRRNAGIPTMNERGEPMLSNFKGKPEPAPAVPPPAPAKPAVAAAPPPPRPAQ